MKLDPEVDLAINVANLSSEFRDFPIIMYRYSQYRATIETQRDMAKARLKEVRATVYKRLRANVSTKHTQSSLEAEIDIDPEVTEAQKKLIRAEHDAATWAGAVESMRSKKDCLIQLGADARKDK